MHNLVQSASSNVSSSEWLESIAKLHNKEMHSTNEYIIEKIWTGSEANRFTSIKQDIQRGLNMEPVKCIEPWDGTQHALEEAENYLPYSKYCDDDHRFGSRTYAAAGTLHQMAEGHIYTRWKRGRTLEQQGEDKERGKEGKDKKLDKGNDKEQDKRKDKEGDRERDKGKNKDAPGTSSPVTISGWRYGPKSYQSTAGDEFVDLGESMLWYGVGLTSLGWNKRYGKLVSTGMGESMLQRLQALENLDLEDESEEESVFNSINSARFILSSMGSMSDWRELGIRVCLYDDAREKRFTQPSGVDTFVARKQEPLTEIIPTHGDPIWGYEAVCVNWKYFCHYINNNGRLPVGAKQEEEFSLHSGDLVVIALKNNVDDVGIGSAIWILSHLDYPLVYTLETFDILSSVQDGITSTYVPFVRTSTLIGVPSRVRTIIFVSMSDRLSVSIGNIKFRIPVLDRFGYPNEGPVIHNFDPGVDVLLKRVMTANIPLARNLKSAFEDYSKAYFSNGLNWMEVDNIATLLKVRWHPRASVEVRPDAAGHNRRNYQFMTKETAHSMGIDENQLEFSLKNMGSQDAVNSLDQVPGTRSEAQDYGPAVYIGTWDFIAELGVVSGFAVYEAFDTDNENKDMMAARVKAGGQDSLVRAGYWRRAVETWKRATGLRDEIATPVSYEELRTEALHRWTNVVDQTVSETGERLINLAYIVSMLCEAKHTNWSWALNAKRTILPTSTGVRTPSSWWICPLNDDWIPFTIEGGPGHTSTVYRLNDRSSSTNWDYNYWSPFNKKEDVLDDFQLESALCRINLEKSISGVDYMDIFERRKVPGYGYNIEGFLSAAIAIDAGWRKFHRVGIPPRLKRWGWGLNVIIRDWKNDSLKKIVLSRYVALFLYSPYLLEETQRFRDGDDIFWPKVRGWKLSDLRKKSHEGESK